MVSPSSLLALVAAAISPVSAACSLEALKSATQAYISAQESGDLASLTDLLTSSATLKFNNKPVSSLTSTPLSKALALDKETTFYDTVECRSYSELVSTAGPYMIGTQLTVSSDSDSPEITALDTTAATTGDWFFNVATTLRYIKDEDWGVLDESSRSSRETLKAAADAYLDMWHDASALQKVPWGSPCARTEGSMHITPDCRVGAPNARSVTASMTNGDRRYVIDEERGTVDVLCNFGGESGGMADSHLFRLVDGKVVLVHTITV